MLEPLLTSADVRTATKISTSAMYRRLKNNTFPKPMKLDGGQLRWKESDIHAWIDAQQRWTGRTTTQKDAGHVG